MILDIVMLVGGLVVLAWSADRFVLGAAASARYLGLPALVIGMVVIGFGTSAPELVVSAFAAAGGNPELALGNAYGSNIANIALILGVTAVIAPIAVRRAILRQEIPILLVATGLAFVLLLDLELSRADAVMLLTAFAAYMVWSVYTGMRTKGDVLAREVEAEVAEHHLSKRAAIGWLIAGLVLLVVSSHFLVEGAVGVATALGLSDLVIGLTVVAVGTSLPELASAIAAVRKGENDLVLGNIIGSSLFNGLAVVGIAGAIAPAVVEPQILTRDLPVVIGLTVALALFGMRWGRDGRINRLEGAVFVVAFVTYTAYVLVTSL